MSTPQGPLGKQYASGSTDRELLERFLQKRKADAESAFADMVERHGPMVYRICREHLHDHHDAEDVFQKVFLALARAAATLEKRDSVASWLHGAALRLSGCDR